MNNKKADCSICERRFSCLHRRVVEKAVEEIKKIAEFFSETEVLKIDINCTDFFSMFEKGK